MVELKKCVQKMKPYDSPLSNRKGKLRLDFNENTIGCSPKVIDALKNITVVELSMYPEYRKFTKKLAQYLKVDFSEVLLTNGTDEAIKVIMDTYVEKNDEIIIPVPTFAMFKVYASLVGARVISVLYNIDLSFPINRVLNNINNKTKLVVLVNPNNPTGTVIKEENIIKILEKAKNSIVLIDEAYYQYYGKSSKGLIKKYDNLIVTQTFSKAFGLAGLRLGYIISNKDIISNLLKVISPYSVNSLALITGSAALEDMDFVNNYVTEVKESKKYVENELNKLGIKIYPSEANFLIANFGNKCDTVCKRLKKKNILVRNRTKYPLLKDCLRIGIGTKEQSTKLINEIKKIIREKVILFDLDGVLVDVSGSYRLAIQKTAEFFTKQEIKANEIQKLKEKSGYNNDWDLTEAIIFGKNVKVPKDNIIQKFQELYFGNNKKDGFIDNEKWLLSKEILSELYKNYRLGIVTGRPKEEAYYVLKKFGVLDFFDVIVTMEDYLKAKAKPDPFSINLALKQLESKKGVYVGDNIDDMRVARNAGIKAVGILPPKISSNKLRSLLRKAGAKIVLENVNQIKKVLK